MGWFLLFFLLMPSSQSKPEPPPTINQIKNSVNKTQNDLEELNHVYIIFVLLFILLYII